MPSISETKQATAKKLALMLTSRKANMRIKGMNYFNDHVCTISFDPANEEFTLSSINSIHTEKISFNDGLTLLKEGKFKNITLFESGELNVLVKKLTGALVGYASDDEDYTSLLTYSEGKQSFLARFGTLHEEMSMFQAKELLKKKELSNIFLLE